MINLVEDWLGEFWGMYRSEQHYFIHEDAVGNNRPQSWSKHISSSTLVIELDATVLIGWARLRGNICLNVMIFVYIT